MPRIHSAKPGRPGESLIRPYHVAIAGGIVSCRHQGCYFESGPFEDRDETCRAAQAHYLDAHARHGAVR